MRGRQEPSVRLYRLGAARRKGVSQESVRWAYAIFVPDPAQIEDLEKRLPRSRGFSASEVTALIALLQGAEALSGAAIQEQADKDPRLQWALDQALQALRGQADGPGSSEDTSAR